MPKLTIVHKEIYKGRKIYITHINTYMDYCNGYVEILEGEGIPEHIKADEITYTGNLDYLNVVEKNNFIGFDSAHAWNDENPESKTKEYVLGTCKKIVEELNKKWKQ